MTDFHWETGKLRSADCIADGCVHVVVMNKKDFLDLDNPLLGWMLDYDAVATVLKVCILIDTREFLVLLEGLVLNFLECIF